MENLDIRLLVDSKKIKYRDIAAAMGIRPDTLSESMRSPLTARQRERIIAAVQILEERKVKDSD